MALSYTTLTGAKTVDESIANWVNNATVPAATVLTEAQAALYTSLRVRDMLARQEDTIAKDATTLALPARYLEAVAFHLTGNDAAVVKQRPKEEVEGDITWDGAARVAGTPTKFYTDATDFVFDHRADKAYGYRVLYFQELAPLAATTNETNFLTDRYPRLLRMACLAAANEFLRDDEEKAYWLALLQAEIEKANGQFDTEQRGVEVLVEAG